MLPIDQGDPPASASGMTPPYPPTPTVLLSIAEAAQALRIGRSKLYELIAAGDIESVHIGRSRRVPSDAVYAFVDRLRDRRRTGRNKHLPADNG